MRDITVVMLVRDRLRLTRQALRSLLTNRQDHSADLNIVIVDDASQPATRIWLSDWAPSANVQLIRHEESRGTGWARNIGVAAAREIFGTDSLLYLSDNDVFFMPGWDTALRATHEFFGGFKIIGGGCHPYLQASDVSCEVIAGYQMATRDAVSGYSWLLDWSTWDEFGPLDAHALGVRQSEDWAMCQKVRKAGYFVGSILPEMVIHTGLTDTFGERPPGWEIMRDTRMKGIIYE
jgi:glycosyltransferase involved in cell wall biosynthesis